MSDFEDNKKAYYHLRALRDEGAVFDGLSQAGRQVRVATFAQLGVKHHGKMS